MALVKHSTLTLANASTIHRWAVADAAALAALTPVAADDKKFALQLDTGELWFLLDYSGPTWYPTGRRGFSNSRTFTASDTLVITDAGGKLYSNVGSGHTLTIPPNATVAFDGLDVVTVIQQGAGAFTVTAGAGVTLVLPTGKTAVSNGAGAIVSMTPRPGTLDTWNVYGDLV